MFWVYEEFEEGEEKSKGWNDGMIDRRKENEKFIKWKKNFLVFFIFFDCDWGCMVIVVSFKVLGKVVKGEVCNYIVCVYKSLFSYVIIVDFMYISVGGYDDIFIGLLWLESWEEMWICGLWRELCFWDFLEKE